MKRRKKLLSLFLAVFLLASNTMTTLAASEDDIMLLWSDVSTITSGMDVNWLGIATIDVSGQASSTSDANKVEVIVDLQSRKVGTTASWETIKSYTDKTDSKFTHLHATYAIAKGYVYQLAITVKAYKGSTLLETATTTYYYGVYN